MNIIATKDYSRFKTILGNRQLNQPYIKRLMASLKVSNFLPYHPIIVNEKDELIDGQHRLEAAKQAKIEVYYAIREGASLDEIILLNSNNRPWGLKDYMESHIVRGNNNYVILKDFITKYGFNIAVGMDLIGDTKNSYINKSKSFKNGSFKIKDLTFALQVADYMVSCKSYLEPNVYASRDFGRVIKKVLNNSEVKPNYLLQKLSKEKQPLKKFVSVIDGLRILEEIYNKGKQNRIRFF